MASLHIRAHFSQLYETRAGNPEPPNNRASTLPKDQHAHEHLSVDQLSLKRPRDALAFAARARLIALCTR